MNTVYLDIETSGLDPFQHEIIEVAMISEDPATEIHFALPFSLRTADPNALAVNKWDRRRLALKGIEITPHKANALFTVYLDGAVVVGNNPQFDLRFIEQFLVRQASSNPTPWHYHPVDLKALVAGRYALGPAPWSTNQIAEAVGVDLDSRAAHTALGDARWNQEVYKKAVEL
jgi:DNA polymerase III epsilon subunit-like protein